VVLLVRRLVALLVQLSASFLLSLHSACPFLSLVLWVPRSEVALERQSEAQLA
jgi:hypothetical protein